MAETTDGQVLNVNADLAASEVSAREPFSRHLFELSCKADSRKIHFLSDTVWMTVLIR